MKNVIKMNYPAQWYGTKWREAMPAGNGETGIGVYGEIFNETVLITHTELWWKTRTQELPDVSYKLPEIRSKLLEGKADAADPILADTLLEYGYDPVAACPLPLCDLKIHMPVAAAFKNYERRLDMEKGEITVSWSEKEKNMKETHLSQEKIILLYTE